MIEMKSLTQTERKTHRGQLSAIVDMLERNDLTFGRDYFFITRDKNGEFEKTVVIKSGNKRKNDIVKKVFRDHKTAPATIFEDTAIELNLRRIKVLEQKYFLDQIMEVFTYSLDKSQKLYQEIESVHNEFNLFGTMIYPLNENQFIYKYFTEEEASLAFELFKEYVEESKISKEDRTLVSYTLNQDTHFDCENHLPKFKERDWMPLVVNNPHFRSDMVNFVFKYVFNIDSSESVDKSYFLRTGMTKRIKIEDREVFSRASRIFNKSLGFGVIHGGVTDNKKFHTIHVCLSSLIDDLTSGSKKYSQIMNKIGKMNHTAFVQDIGQEDWRVILEKLWNPKKIKLNLTKKKESCVEEVISKKKKLIIPTIQESIDNGDLMKVDYQQTTIERDSNMASLINEQQIRSLILPAYKKSTFPIKKVQYSKNKGVLKVAFNMETGMGHLGPNELELKEIIPSELHKFIRNVKSRSVYFNLTEEPQILPKTQKEVDQEESPKEPQETSQTQSSPTQEVEETQLTENQLRNFYKRLPKEFRKKFAEEEFGVGTPTNGVFVDKDQPIDEVVVMVLGEPTVYKPHQLVSIKLNKLTE